MATSLATMAEWWEE
jgi:hypothetical protein